MSSHHNKATLVATELSNPDYKHHNLTFHSDASPGDVVHTGKYKDVSLYIDNAQGICNVSLHGCIIY